MTRAWCWAAIGVLIVMTGCGGSDRTGADPTGPGRVRIASFDFAESELIAELYAQVIEARGLDVERLGPIGPREIVAPSLEQGLVDVVPEYLGTAAVHFGATSPDPAAVAAVLADRGLRMLDAAPAEDVNVFVVTADTAREHGLATVSDLAAVAEGFRFGGPVECPDRPFCLAGLSSTYGLSFAEFVPLRTLAVTGDALERGEVDVGVMFSTSAELTSGPFVSLVDDRGLQPPDFVVPVVRAEALERWGPELSEPLNDLSAELTTGALQGMNRRVQDGVTVAETATGWLRSVGLIAG